MGGECIPLIPTPLLGTMRPSNAGPTRTMSTNNATAMTTKTNNKMAGDVAVA